MDGMSTKSISVLVLTLMITGGLSAADACTGCTGCMRSLEGPVAQVPIEGVGEDAGTASQIALPAVSSIIVNPVQPITKRVTIRVIRVADNDGSNLAPMFGTASQQADIIDTLDEIWAQAGIDVKVTFRAAVWNNTFANRGNSSSRPRSDLSAILNAAISAGVASTDPLTLNVFMVRVVPGFQQTGGLVGNGLAFRGGNGIAMWAGPDLLPFPRGRDLIAAVLAHEIGHNLGLPHLDQAENLMSSDFNLDQGERLTSAQINISRGSSFARSAPVSMVRSIQISLFDGAAIAGQVVVFDDASPTPTTASTNGGGVASASGFDSLVDTVISFPPGGSG